MVLSFSFLIKQAFFFFISKFHYNQGDFKEENNWNNYSQNPNNESQGIM